MNSTPDHTHSAHEAASLWATRLEDPSFSSADRDALDAWLRSAPEHPALLQSYLQLSDTLTVALPALAANGKLAPAPSSSHRQPSRWKTWLIASTLATAALTLTLHLRSPAPLTHTTASAQRHNITLQDGTLIELNARSSLQVQLTSSERHVTLSSGEAFFSVTKNTAQPFIIETPAGTIRVTGTAFNVRSRTESELEVTVIEGSVEVRPKLQAETPSGAPLALTARTRFGSSIGAPISLQSLAPEQIEQALAWRQGRIIFSDTSLLDATCQLAAYHGRPIDVSAQASTLKLGGRFNLDDFETLLNSLEEILPIRITRLPGGALQIKLKGEP